MKMDSYYKLKYNFLIPQFINPKLEDRFLMRCRNGRNNLKVFIPIFIFCVLTMPMTVQYRAVRGDYGILWKIATYHIVLAPFVIFSLIVSEIYKDEIERLLISKEIYYYKYKEILNKVFFVNHTITINYILYLRSLRVCDKDKDISVFDNHYCNSVPGIPLDTFSMAMFFAILYQSMLGLPFIYNFLAQVLELFVLMLIVYNTGSIETFPVSSISLVMFFGVCGIQYYMHLATINSFIMEDKIKSYDAINMNNFNTIPSTQSLNDAIYYHDEKVLRKVAYSDSRINYDLDEYVDNRSRSSTLTSFTSSI